MGELKVGDRVRLSTGVEGVVDRVDGHGSFGVYFGDAGGYYNSRNLEALNITWELVEPEPSLVEPVTDWSVIRFLFADYPLVAIRVDGWWLISGFGGSYTWGELVSRYKVDRFVLLSDGSDEE